MMQREITIRKAAAPQMVYAAPGQQVIGAPSRVAFSQLYY